MLGTSIPARLLVGARPRRLSALSLYIALSLLLALGCGSSSAGPATGPSARPPSAPMSDCGGAGVALQVLGSGGPIRDDERASSGYLIWIDGRARLLIDLGPGAMSRYGQSGADPSDLDAILLTHLHVDHSADLPAFAKTASFGSRVRPLPILGPSGGDRFPSLDELVATLFGDSGTYRYLGGYLGDGQPFVLSPQTVDVTAPEAQVVFSSERVRVRAVGVPHGIVPALAYEVTVGDTRIAFMGDQRADEDRYVDMIRGVDLLVAHMAVGTDADPVAARLHAEPARLGEVAVEAGVGRLVLSHLMARSLRDLDGNVAAVRADYDGPLDVASDGLCIRL